MIAVPLPCAEIDPPARVELQGQVGTVRFSPGGKSLIANFSVMVEHELTSREGRPVIECTWLNVTAVEGRDIRLDHLARGLFVHLCKASSYKEYL